MTSNATKKSLRFFALATLALGYTANVPAQTPAPVAVNLTAQRSSLTLPDQKVVPMWQFCGTVPPATTSTCVGPWAPGPTIVVPVGGELDITLTNSLPTATSIVILGQLGGGKDSTAVGGGVGHPTMVPSPDHLPKQATTWPTNAGATFTPPTQGLRMQSFGAETGPNGTQTYTWTGLRAGTYLYETGTNPSIQVPMGLYGVIVVTNAPTPATSSTTLVPGQAYPNAFPQSNPLTSEFMNVPYDSDAVMLLSEIDLAQNLAVDSLCPPNAPCTSISTAGYPAAVNYAPTYFLMNGKPFDRTNPTGITVPAGAISGKVLLRFANAGSQTHVPSVVGLNMHLIAEDGNVLPGVPKIQSEVLLPAAKTYDVLVNPPANLSPGNYNTATYGVFDRELSLSAGNTPDSGIQTFLLVGNGATPPSAITPTVNPDIFKVPDDGNPFQGNVLLNDTAIYNASLEVLPTDSSGTPTLTSQILSLASGTVLLGKDGSFTFTPTGPVSYPVQFNYCGNGLLTLCTQVTLNKGVSADAEAPAAANGSFTSLVATSIRVASPGVLGLVTDPSNYAVTAKLVSPQTGITLNPDGSFTAASTVTSFTYQAVNSRGVASNTATVNLSFPTGSGLQLSVVDALSRTTPITDYRWTIEEDVTFHNSLDPVTNTAVGPNTIALNFHKSYMPLVATGCVGPISCGSGQTAGGQPVAPQAQTSVGDVLLDPNKYYYISILPGDAANAFIKGTGDPSTCTAATCGHTMGGVNISPGQKSATVLVEPNPLQTAQLSVFVFEDNNPTNGDIDGVEENQGLGGFQITINDTAGRTGDPAGLITYDAFNMPLTNALMGTPDCPYVDATGKILQNSGVVGGTPIGMIITCPSGINPKTGQQYTLAGQALIKNLMPGRFDIFANPGAGREQAGETWLQVSTLEGTHANDAFAKSGEPAYFQEFGPPGYHAFIGFVNPGNVEKTHKALIGTNTNLHAITGQIVNLHMSRPVKEDLFAGSHAPLEQTTCYIGLNSQSGTGANVDFTKCDQDGNFKLTGVPDGAYQIVVWDDWLDLIIESKDVTVSGGDVAMGKVPAFSWFTRLETTTFMDEDGSHRPGKNPGVAQVPTTIRFRDGSFSNKLVTDSNGVATFDELFPLFNWYVVESDTTRFKGSAVHVVVDGGGQPDSDGTKYGGILNSTYPYPAGQSTERFDDGKIQMEGLQGFINQTNVTDWGKVPYAQGENGGITGTVVYSSTRPFDDPRFLFQNLWEPMVPRVTILLYREVTTPDGSQGLQYVATTQTTSWDDVANATGPNAMNCPGQDPGDPFVTQTIGVNNLTKCYDGFHAFNQVQPAVYDGRYYFNGIPAGKYVVQMVLPPGYELVKEEDKNILIGDAWIAATPQQFGPLTNIFILPDQAEVGAAQDPNGNYTTANEGRTGGGVLYPTCVGSSHRVPDFLTLFPLAQQVAPFAGADRPLCDRKEVVLEDQMQANADFFVYTSAHIAGHYTGMILNDAASEMNAASPDFGEKFAVPNVPISFKDFNGIEIQRTYADQWGNFNGLTPSSWQVNVPNPAGYSPNMLIQCMNDPGPIVDPTDPTGQRMITDPQYNPMYSNFCYTNAFMPGLTDYLDTPVIPVSAFATAYSQTDCAYPDATPAILRVDSSAGFGPYLTTAGGTLTITALGNQTVLNPAYGGPKSTVAKNITRHYGFGSTPGKVMIGNTDVTAYVTSGGWTDQLITLNLTGKAVAGQVVITAANGKSSVDAVTVTVENATPKRVDASGANGAYPTIQAAIDAANPGDLILVNAGSYNELVIMWKPVRLQGVGAASVIINAAKYPTNKLEAWRPRINSLFNIDAAGNQLPNAQVDPLPGQSITGGVVLLEPSVLGQEEGAGITVLAKNANQLFCFIKTKNPTYVSNFYCNPSRIDGISVTGGDAGGGIFVNGWAHNLEIANNRVYGNAGSFHGGIRVGIPYLEELTGGPFGFDKNVYIHHNSVTNNGTVEANAGDSGAGGGVSICSGTDNYRLNYNFICGNFASTDGGGIGHIGVSDGGTIAHNQILFNQSYAQSNTVHGGGITIEGETPAGAGLSLGTGNVVVDSNLIQGNYAESGSGGGIRLQNVNGAEIARRTLYKVTLTNNIIVNNVAGLAGGGIALQNALNTSIVNNTVASNDSVGIVGALFSLPGLPVTAYPNPAGISTEPTSTQLVTAAAQTLLPTASKTISNPQLINNIIWQNRSFFFDGTKGNVLCPSNKFTDAAAHNCGNPTSYWDLGVLGDQTTVPGTKRLNPTNSILTDTTGYTTTSIAPIGNASNTTNAPSFKTSYFNASSAIPGLLLPPQAYAAFATLDEGGNFVDLSYGPLTPTGDYRITTGSGAIDTGASNFAPTLDYFGTTRPQGAGFDIGAHEFVPVPAPKASISPTALAFGNVIIGQTSTLTTIVSNTGTAPLTINSITIAAPYSIGTGTNACGTTVANGATCTLYVVFTPTAVGSTPGTLTIAENDPVNPTLTVSLTGTGVAKVVSATFTPTTWTPSAKVGVGAGFIPCVLGGGPCQIFTLTNTGNVNLTGVTVPTLTGAAASNYTIIANPLFPACTAGLTLTTTALGRSCYVTVQFRPVAPAGAKNATLSVSDLAGTQSVTITGTAR